MTAVPPPCRSPRLALAGQSVLGVVWALAARLGVVARTPAELVAALAADGRRPLIALDGADTAREPLAVCELVEWLAELGTVRLRVTARPGTAAYAKLAAVRRGSLELSEAADAPEEHAPFAGRLDDPVAVCAADPPAVTAAYAGDDDPHGGLRPAWLRAGQALCAEPDPAGRALVLLAALSDAADPRLRPALARQAAGAPWRLVWNRVQGDVAPPWPGPVAALAGAAGRLLTADPAGRVRPVRPDDGRPVGRPWDSGRRVRALASLVDGRVLGLDERGRLSTDRPDPLTDAVTAVLAAHPGSALAAAGATIAVGDRLGSLHAFERDGVRQTAAHQGRVTALGALAGPAGVTVYSGGADGAVRAWRPRRGAPPARLVRRDCPVAAVHAARTDGGTALAVAWADGLVELRRPGGGAPLGFRPGPPVRAVAVTAAGALVVGLDEALICLAPALV
ncbi:hypothetical protein [Streptomyces sp. ODS05-4]|uniref:hypothetical protein n=1 Tax=Streptomyces sp. ODS05-4 TaxID=2944939 RepID=UPI00210CE479|nr:hypothetical protein [Streptomyces sp. ODS05-4]